MAKPKNSKKPSLEVTREERPTWRLGHSWLCFKMVKFIVIFICLVMLPVNAHIYSIDDDFTDIEDNFHSSDVDSQMTTSNPSPNKRSLLPLGDSDDHRNTQTKLSDLLVMYPCCLTVIIILGMEMGGRALKDPLTKWPSLILSCTSLLLVCIVFIISLMAIMRYLQAVMIVICVLSMLFLILQAVDISLSLLP